MFLLRFFTISRQIVVQIFLEVCHIESHNIQRAAQFLMQRTHDTYVFAMRTSGVTKRVTQETAGFAKVLQSSLLFTPLNQYINILGMYTVSLNMISCWQSADRLSSLPGSAKTKHFPEKTTEGRGKLHWVEGRVVGGKLSPQTR